MELRRISIFAALLVLACVSQCSEARHAIQRRATDDDVNYDDILADEASDDEAQKDAEGNDQADEEMVNAVILTQPANYSVTVGRNVRLDCKVSPASGVVVQWKKGNSMMFFGTLKAHEQDLKTYNVEDRFTIPANSTDLLIRDIRPSDSGLYNCEVLQEARTRIEHSLVVLESPRIVRLTATDNGQVVEGTNLVLTCEVSGSPPPQIIWSREGENGGNERLQEKDGEFSVNSVHIKNVRKHHSGKYYCYAFNSIGNNQSEVSVIVRGKPRVHVHRTVINSAVNVEAVLQCSVHDEPASHIRWYKDGKRVADSSNHYIISTDGQHSNLTLTPTNDQDFGTFTCEAENELGKHNKSIDLVQSPVVEDLNVEGPKMSWIIHSHQPLQQIEIQLREIDGEGEWRTLSVPIPEGSRRMYDISYSLEDKVDAGKYEATVKVKNDKSWSVHSNTAMVDIEAQPLLVQHASVYRGNNAHSIRPTTTAMISTILMYLLVRML